MLQLDEIEALSSIYADDWCVIDAGTRSYCVKVHSDASKPVDLMVLLQILTMHFHITLIAYFYDN